MPRYRLVVGFLFPHVDDAQSILVLSEHSLLQLLATSRLPAELENTVLCLLQLLTKLQVLPSQFALFIH